MKRGPLHQVQARSGVTFVERDGWALPAAFRSPAEELNAWTGRVGMADFTGWGLLRLQGRDRLDFIQRMSTNDVLRLEPDQGAPTVFTTPIGRIVDLAFVLVRKADLLLAVGRGADEVVAGWLRRHIFFNDDVLVENMTDQWGVMGCSGPGATALVAELLGPIAAGLAPFQALAGQIEGVDVTVMRAAPLGADYLLLAQAEQAPALWKTLAVRVEAVGGALVGETARETARVGAGWPSFGRELTEDYIPLEAGLKWAVSFNKGCYVGQEIIARMDARQRLAKRLVVLGCRLGTILGNAGLAPGDEVRTDDERVGRVTSVSPLADGGMIKALAYVKPGVAAPGRELSVTCREDELAATVLAVPGES